MTDSAEDLDWRGKREPQCGWDNIYAGAEGGSRNERYRDQVSEGNEEMK